MWSFSYEIDLSIRAKVLRVGGWTFLTNHARVLRCIAHEPGVRIRDIACCAEITERTAHPIVRELSEAGYLTRHRVGRRNVYEVHPQLPLRHKFDQDHEVGEILAVLTEPREEKAA